jgi:hypothetical protein
MVIYTKFCFCILCITGLSKLVNKSYSKDPPVTGSSLSPSFFYSLFFHPHRSPTQASNGAGYTTKLRPRGVARGHKRGNLAREGAPGCVVELPLTTSLHCQPLNQSEEPQAGDAWFGTEAAHAIRKTRGGAAKKLKKRGARTHNKNKSGKTHYKRDALE